MPIKIRDGLPAKDMLEKENIFVRNENRVTVQDIRPLHILILNLMPLKENTELQLLRLLSNSPLQIDIDFLATSSHISKNTSSVYLEKYYSKFEDIRNQQYDGMIITGAPVENYDYKEVTYWSELVEIMNWSKQNVASTIFICWAAQAAPYHFYGLRKKRLSEKVFGIYRHQNIEPACPLVRGFDEYFMAPHSRHTEVPLKDISNCKDITILTMSKEVGFF